jgi:alkanesulfonate monooxygenase SsuD/methylene tetrahydromethanopterin reductase-like flavin-dependent oxidoreductase (luciferase family)
MDEPVVDPWVTLAAVAVKTQRIRIGAFMTPMARRRPWQVARQTATLDHLSNGRLVFGAALGYQALDFVSFGESYDPKIRAEKLDEGLQVLTGLWAGEAFSFHGKHYQLDNVKFASKPVQSPRIPIWLAGGWPRRKPLRRAARWDGIYLMTVNQTTNAFLTPREITEIVDYFQAYRKSTEPFDIALNVEIPSDLTRQSMLYDHISKPERHGALFSHQTLSSSIENEFGMAHLKCRAMRRPTTALSRRAIARRIQWSLAVCCSG